MPLVLFEELQEIEREVFMMNSATMRKFRILFSQCLTPCRVTKYIAGNLLRLDFLCLIAVASSKLLLRAHMKNERARWDEAKALASTTGLSFTK